MSRIRLTTPLRARIASHLKKRWSVSDLDARLGHRPMTGYIFFTNASNHINFSHLLVFDSERINNIKKRLHTFSLTMIKTKVSEAIFAHLFFSRFLVRCKKRHPFFLHCNFATKTFDKIQCTMQEIVCGFQYIVLLLLQGDILQRRKHAYVLIGQRPVQSRGQRGLRTVRDPMLHR
jgi:hypothetical protein